MVEYRLERVLVYGLYKIIQLYRGSTCGRVKAYMRRLSVAFLVFTT